MLFKTYSAVGGIKTRSRKSRSGKTKVISRASPRLRAVSGAGLADMRASLRPAAGRPIRLAGMNIDQYRVTAGKRARLSDWNTDDDGGLTKEEGQAKTAELAEELAEWQERLYAEGKQSLLLVLQARDAAGKDGAVKKVIGAFNPAGVQIANFKQPSAEELSHDFLWRIHQKAPAKGYVGVFNRSHYEDVLVTRVYDMIDDQTARSGQRVSHRTPGRPGTRSRA